MTKAYVLDDGSKKAQYLIEYLKDEGYKVEAFAVDPKSSLAKKFEQIMTNDGTKVFLHYTVDDLRANKERIRDEIKGLESYGWRNLIVLPFEGMDDKTMEKNIQKANVFTTKDQVPEGAGVPKEHHTITLKPDEKTGQWNIKDHTVEIDKPVVPGFESGHIDPDTEMKDNNPVKSELDVASIDQDKEDQEWKPYISIPGDHSLNEGIVVDPEDVKRYKVTDKEVKEVNKDDTKKGRKRKVSDV